MSENQTTIRPMALRKTAGAIASQYGDKGAIIITVGEDGTRVGVTGLTPDEVRAALCVGIHYSFLQEDGDV